MVVEAFRKMLDIRVRVKHQLFFLLQLVTFIFLSDEWGVK